MPTSTVKTGTGPKAAPKGWRGGGVACARALKALGAPVGAGRALILGADKTLSRAIETELKPKESVSAEGLTAADAGRADRDLIVVAGGLAQCRPAEAHARMQALAASLAPGGRLVAFVSTMAAPIAAGDGVGAYDALLFPEVAASGELGPDTAERAALSPSTWIMLARSVGLRPIGQVGAGEQPLPADLMAAHGGRLSVFDPLELAADRLVLVLAREGDQ